MPRSESPQLSQDSPASINGAPPPHFTHITVNGCNLIGLLNVFACIGALALMSILPVNGILGLIWFALVIGGCIAFDFSMRIRSAERPVWLRLLSPHAGGALFFLPVWAIYPGMAITGLALVLLKK